MYGSWKSSWGLYGEVADDRTMQGAVNRENDATKEVKLSIV